MDRGILKINKLILFVLSISGIFLNFSLNNNVERKYAQGVEIIINHLKPNQTKGKYSTFSLEKVLTIDTERADLASAGMGEAGEYDVDLAGNIYIVSFKNKENFVYKFNNKGKLIHSFGKYGQGPGELEWPLRPTIIGQNKIAITDRLRKKLTIFDSNGNLISEKMVPMATEIEPLENGNYLMERFKREHFAPEYYTKSLYLCDSKFNEIKELDEYKSPFENTKIVPFFMWRVSAGYIYIVNEERGYEIWVYDLDGNLIRKIRKKYHSVTATEEIKRLFIGPGYRKSGDSHDKYFPKPLPPLNQFFTDDEGRIYVMTYEVGKEPGEYIYDIFNREGVFIGRKSLNIFWARLYYGPKYTMAKKGYLYCYKEKESGYRELNVYKMKWFLSDK